MRQVKIFFSDNIYKHLERISKNCFFKNPGYYLKHLAHQDVIEKMNGFMSESPLDDKYTDKDII